MTQQPWGETGPGRGRPPSGWGPPPGYGPQGGWAAAQPPPTQPWPGGPPPPGGPGGPPPGGPGDDPGGGGGRVLLWLIVIATLAAAIIALVVVLVVVNTGGSGDRGPVAGHGTSTPATPVPSASSSPQSTRPSSSTRSSSTTTTTTGSSSTTTAPTTTAREVRLPRDVDLCADGEEGIELQNVGAKSGTTSCPFAEEVRLAYLQQPDRSGKVTVEAVSPVTGDRYTMTCRGSAPVVCEGGDDAQVYLY